MEIIYNIMNALGSAHFKIALGIFIFIVAICFYLLSFTGKQKANKSINRIERLREYNSNDYIKEEEYVEGKQNAYDQYVKPYIQKNKSLYNKLLSNFGIKIEDIEKELKRANITKYNADQIATLKVGGVIIGVFLGVALIFFNGLDGLLIGIGIGLASNMLPGMMIKEEYEKRKRNILNVLPTTLRLLADATSTGHTIDDAIMRVSRKYNTTLSSEFRKAEEEAKYTNDWILALENMEERCDIMELTNLVSEIKITKLRGTSITEVLVNYAKKMEEETMIRITEEARKKTTTLLMPILLFLFGPLLGIILLPTFDLVLQAL